MTAVTGAAVAPARSGPGVLDWMLVSLLTALSGVIGLFGILFLPFYVRAIPMPVVVVPVGLALAALPRMTYRLTESMVAAAAPPVLWFAVVASLNLTENALYRGLPLAWRGWQFLLLLGVGLLASACSVGLLWGVHLRAGMPGRVNSDRPVTEQSTTPAP